MQKKRWLIGFFVILLALGTIALFSLSSQGLAENGATTSLSVTATASEAAPLDVPKAMSDRFIGDPRAPVTLIEYASMSCGHCASFHNDILPQLKSEYVDTGKVRLVYRDYPLNAAAMQAAMLARCAPEDKYFQLVEVIFANQSRWLSSRNPIQSLMQLGRLAGMSESQMEACLANESLETALLQKVQEAQARWDVRSTPTFIFNNGAETFVGAMPYEDFQQTIERLLARAR